jgi:16S rRNA processing protein RimM
LAPLDDPDQFYDHELLGLSAVLSTGEPLGTVADVVHGPAGELLVIGDPDGGEHLVPFVRAIVTAVDVAAGRVVIDPPPGLLKLS